MSKQMKFLDAFNTLDNSNKIGIKRSKDEIGFIIKKNNNYKVVLDSKKSEDYFLNTMDYCFNADDKNADDWVVIDLLSLKEIKYVTIEEQLKFINETIQSNCMEKENNNLIYFYIPEVSSQFADSTSMGKTHLSNIVYDINNHKTIKSRWYNLQDVYFDFLNKQFYKLGY